MSIECIMCGKDADGSDSTSTFCGTCHYECFADHAAECDVCRDDGIKHGLLEADEADEADEDDEDEDDEDDSA